MFILLKSDINKIPVNCNHTEKVSSEVMQNLTFATHIKQEIP